MRRPTFALALALARLLTACANAPPDASGFASDTVLAAVDTGTVTDATAPDEDASIGADLPAPGTDVPAPGTDVPAPGKDADAAGPDLAGPDGDATADANQPPADVPKPADGGCSKNGCPDGNACEIATCEPDGHCATTPKDDGTACGAGHTCYSGVCVPDPPKALQLVASGDTTCARLADGTVRCWGYGSQGQLGDGKSDNGHHSAMPVVVQGVAGATDLACGANHCCTVGPGGKVQCWGGNDQGQSSPTAGKFVQAKAIDVPGVMASQIAAGEYHTCVLAAGGKVRCWGLGTSGQLGDGNAGLTTKIVDVAWSGYAMEVRAGHHFTCARTAQGQAFCWGSNQYGQIGDGQGGTSKEADLPAQVGGLSGVSQLGLGELHGCAALKNGDAQCWGQANSSQLGSGGQNSYYTTPQLAGVGGVVFVSAGGAHTCALLNGDIVSCWGANNRGQAGQGSALVVKNPTVVPGLDAVALGGVAAGSQHTCALGLDGSVWCWGANDSGQCGAGPKDMPTPAQMTF